MDPILAKYVQDCHDAIFPNWAANAALIKQTQLRVTVKVIVSEDGTMSNPEIYASSLNHSFDESATMAIQNPKTPPSSSTISSKCKSRCVITLSAKDNL